MAELDRTSAKARTQTNGQRLKRKAAMAAAEGVGGGTAVALRTRRS